MHRGSLSHQRDVEQRSARAQAEPFVLCLAAGVRSWAASSAEHTACYSCTVRRDRGIILLRSSLSCGSLAYDNSPFEWLSATAQRGRRPGGCAMRPAHNLWCIVSLIWNYVACSKKEVIGFAGFLRGVFALMELECFGVVKASFQYMRVLYTI